MNVQISFPTDYWLYCVTSSIESRLFIDFNADACVIIRDRTAFAQMLREATEKALPSCVMQNGPATYVDPLLPQFARIFVPMVKHFGYSYQEEHRFCWLPRVTSPKLSHLDIEIGSLAHIAEMIAL